MLPEVLFFAFFLLQLFFYLYLFRKYAFGKRRDALRSEAPVSLIICARNEGENLKRLLPAIAAQEYQSFQVILVNDSSTDETASVMDAFKKNSLDRPYSVQVIHILLKSGLGKKTALDTGIRSAKYDRLLLTDADCMPGSTYWIREMMGVFESGNSIVLGYGAYKKIKGSLLNKLVRMETLLTAMQYFSFARAGRPYMGVGRNLAYLKRVYENSDGFKGNENLPSGDDDLFINRVAGNEKTGICDHPDAFTLSEPPENFRHWIRQKRRHITTAHHYKPFHRNTLGLFYMSQLLFYVFGIWALIVGSMPALILTALMTRFIVWYVVVGQTASRLREKDLVALGPIYEISIIFIQLYIFLRNRIAAPKKW